MVDNKQMFINYAIKHGKAIEHGDHKLANKLHTQLSNLYKNIKESTNWDELKELVKYPDESVRLWAATFLLQYDTNLGLKVLDELKESEKIIGLTALTVVDMWNKGMLKL